MKKYTKHLFVALASSTLLACGGASQAIFTPVTNSDNAPVKKQELTEEEMKIWWQMDFAQDTVPGMSVIRTYDEIIKNKKGKTVVVAIIDSGADIEHEDLKNVLWKNKKEIPGNGIDDDKNGFIDDVYGWNFLGDIVGENMEFVRILKKLSPRFDGKDASEISNAETEEYTLYKKAKQEYEKEKQQVLTNKLQYDAMLSQIIPAHEKVAEKLGKENYNAQDLATLQDDASLEQEIFILQQMLAYEDSVPKVLGQLGEGKKYFDTRLEYHFNLDTDFRAILGDDLNDINDAVYGDGKVIGPEADKAHTKHGTHVSGIVAAERNNGIGMNGVANNVEIMTIRAVPDGDEYDKDIALSIRYAVDNGAKVINGSFGKMYATHSQWVYDAIKYAAEKDVLFVHAAGNDGLNMDDEGIEVYPNDAINNVEFADNFLTVGALSVTYGKNLLAPFSNYGKENVDVFAPGVKIWATVQNNEYEFLQGTSMAAPAVAGVAAMLRSYFPDLTAVQVKQIIMDSGVPANIDVVLGGEPDNVKSFSEVSKSGKMVNMYNAFIMAKSISKK